VATNALDRGPGRTKEGRREKTQMTKAKALRLRPGEVITFGDHQYTRNCTRWCQGEVIHVTKNGGILVKIIDEKPWFGPREYRRRFGDVETWVPYHHVT
jgi:hypothetical protein